MNNKKKLLYCLIANFLLFIFLIIIINIFGTSSNYFRFGVPSSHEEPLVVISIEINTYIKYSLLLFIISVINISKVIIDSVGTPILDWNIYNPDKDRIIDFKKNELLIYSNLFYLFTSLRYIFTVLISITQIDIALYSVLISQITTFFTIKLLLDEKKFDDYHTIEDFEKL